MAESELIERFKRGDRSAFDALVELHRARVEGLARRFLGDAHEALDVAQDVFVAAFRTLPTWRPDAQLFTWLYRTTLNLCAKRLRSRGRVLSMADPVAEGTAAPAEPLDRGDLAQAIDEALEALSEKQREVFLGCHERGLTLDEVAARLSIAPGTARSHLHRALVTLRDRLKSRRLL
ncbi:MAG TPA: RNA polymerase sigma factor [Planctomycetota bacterium]|nr:RNA polymerase sigma factor [Planctomycetota bacterium]